MVARKHGNWVGELSHDRGDETREAKVSWFQSLSVEERVAYLNEITEIAIASNPDLLKGKPIDPGRKGVLVLRRSELKD